MKWTLFFLLSILFSLSAYAGREIELAKQARELLSSPEHVAGGSMKTSFDVKLAIKKEGEGQFRVITVHGSGKQICQSKDETYAMWCRQDKFGRTNGLGTHYAVLRPEGFKVYAIRRVTLSGKEEISSPYSDPFNVPEVKEAGVKYFENLMQRAVDDLRVRQVRSLTDQSLLVADRVDYELIRRIMLIEHIDHDRFHNEPYQKLVDEVYVTLGLNGARSYSLAKSTASANGLMQFTERTYNWMRVKFPKAGLHPEFVAGTLDHLNAVKAAMLLTDHDVSRIPHDLRRKVVQTTWLLHEFIASAYNGGVGRPLSIIKRSGDLVYHNSNKENQTYLKKFRAFNFSAH